MNLSQSRIPVKLKMKNLKIELFPGDLFKEKINLKIKFTVLHSRKCY